MKGQKVDALPIAAPMVEAYNSGLTIKQVAARFGVSTGKTYYILRDYNCRFSKARYERKPMSEELKRKLWLASKNHRWTEAEKKQLSEKKKSHLNGLNGYGHLKPHASGYVRAYVPDHPNAAKDGYVMLHTVIMERALGRYLTVDEEVHHLNRKKDDNRLENLCLMNKHEHHSMHMKERHAKRRNDLLTLSR